MTVIIPEGGGEETLTDIEHGAAVSEGTAAAHADSAQNAAAAAVKAAQVSGASVETSVASAETSMIAAEQASESAAAADTGAAAIAAALAAQTAAIERLIEAQAAARETPAPVLQSSSTSTKKAPDRAPAVKRGFAAKYYGRG